MSFTGRPRCLCRYDVLTAGILFVAIMLWLDLARAAPNAAQNSEMRSVITNKLELLDVLVHRSPAVKRIERSQDEQAKLLLEQARKMFRDAQGQLESGDSEMLEAMLDEGLRTAGDASRRVVDAERRQRLDQERYQQLRQRALSFREALEGVMAEKGLDSDETTDTAKFDASLLAAGRAADQGKYAEANQKLQELTGVLEVALVRARDQDTLVYELKFDSPKEEYAYERERNRSHIMLLDMLRQSRPTSAQAAGHFEKLLERNEILKREAEAQAARGEIEEAVKTLEQGTASLVQALRIGGLAF